MTKAILGAALLALLVGCGGGGGQPDQPPVGPAVVRLGCSAGSPAGALITAMSVPADSYTYPAYAVQDRAFQPLTFTNSGAEPVVVQFAVTSTRRVTTSAPADFMATVAVQDETSNQSAASSIDVCVVTAPLAAGETEIAERGAYLLEVPAGHTVRLTPIARIIPHAPGLDASIETEGFELAVFSATPADL